MRRLIWTGIAILASVTGTGMAQSLHPPVISFPINDVPAQPAEPEPQAVTPPRPVVAAAAVPEAPQPIVREQIGDVTQQLLAAQAQGVRAGVDQPMLGATATAAWDRYIKSFNYPIPEWFEKTVVTD